MRERSVRKIVLRWYSVGEKREDDWREVVERGGEEREDNWQYYLSFTKT